VLNYRTNSSGIELFEWVRLPGNLTCISAGLQKYTNVDNENNIWGVNRQQEIWRWPHTDPGPLDDWITDRWERIQGALVQISVGPAGLQNQPLPTVWGVNATGKVWRWRGNFGTGNTWDKIAGTFKKVSVGAGGVWGIDSKGDTYQWTGGGGVANWTHVTSQYGPFADIAVGDTQVWGITSAGQIVRRPIAGGAALGWYSIAGSLVQIAASGTDVCGVNAQGHVYCWRGSAISQANTWLKLWPDRWPVSSGFKLKQVTVGENPPGSPEQGIIFGVDIVGHIWLWKQTSAYL